MTEPDVASSDAANIQCRIERNGSDYVVNGRKWCHRARAIRAAKLFIVMGKTDPARRIRAAVDDPRGARGAGVRSCVP